jgi:hypothetical protein
MTFYFDAIYVINLPSRRDRRTQMNEQFRKIGIDPNSAPVVYFDAIRPDDAGGFPTLGTRGCFLSHLGVLRAARTAGHQRILVVEDDLNFSRDFVERFEPLTERLECMNWDFWYLSTLSVTPPVKSTDDLIVLPHDSAVLGAHMFAVKSQAIEQLIPYLEAILARPPGDPAGGPMHVDGAYGWYRRSHPAIRTVMATRALGYQRPSRTDIHALKWFDRLPIVNRAIGFVRGVRAGLSGER